MREETHVLDLNVYIVALMKHIKARETNHRFWCFRKIPKMKYELHRFCLPVCKI